MHLLFPDKVYRWTVVRPGMMENFKISALTPGKPLHKDKTNAHGFYRVDVRRPRNAKGKRCYARMTTAVQRCAVMREAVPAGL